MTIHKFSTNDAFEQKTGILFVGIHRHNFSLAVKDILNLLKEKISWLE